MISALAIEFNDEWMDRKYLTMEPQEIECWNCLIQTPVGLHNSELLLNVVQGAPAGHT